MKARQHPGIRLVALVAFSICFSPFIHGQDTTVAFTGPPEELTAGSPASIWLNVLNPSDREVSWTFLEKLDCRLVSSHPVLESALDLRRRIEAGQVAIGPGAFARKEYLLAVPACMTGQVVVEFQRPRLQGIKDPWLKMPAIPCGRLMGVRRERLASAVLIMVKSGCEAELSPKLLEAKKSEEDASCISTKK